MIDFETVWKTFDGMGLSDALRTEFTHDRMASYAKQAEWNREYQERKVMIEAVSQARVLLSRSRQQNILGYMMVCMAESYRLFNENAYIGGAHA